jgi:hypothetical protein
MSINPSFFFNKNINPMINTTLSYIQLTKKHFLNFLSRKNSFQIKAPIQRTLFKLFKRTIPAKDAPTADN